MERLRSRGVVLLRRGCFNLGRVSKGGCGKIRVIRRTLKAMGFAFGFLMVRSC